MHGAIVMHLRSRFDTMPRKDLQSYNPLQPGVSGYKTYTLLREFITKQSFVTYQRAHAWIVY